MFFRRIEQNDTPVLRRHLVIPAYLTDCQRTGSCPASTAGYSQLIEQSDVIRWQLVEDMMAVLI